MTQPTTPPLDAGLVSVEGPDRGATQQLVRGADREGETLWVDAGGVAETYGLLDEGATHRDLHGIRVARAFQAHQHHQLVRDLVGEASERTALVVAPNLAVPYEAADGAAGVGPEPYRAVSAGHAGRAAVVVLAPPPRDPLLGGLRGDEFVQQRPRAVGFRPQNPAEPLGKLPL